MKKIFDKKTIFSFVLGIMLSGGIVYAASYYAKDISYQSSDASWEVSNVNDAINDLYNMVNNNYNNGYSDGYNDGKEYVKNVSSFDILISGNISATASNDTSATAALNTIVRFVHDGTKWNSFVLNGNLTTSVTSYWDNTGNGTSIPKISITEGERVETFTATISGNTSASCYAETSSNVTINAVISFVYDGNNWMANLESGKINLSVLNYWGDNKSKSSDLIIKIQ